MMSCRLLGHSWRPDRVFLFGVCRRCGATREEPQPFQQACSRAHVVPDGQACPEHDERDARDVRNPLRGVSGADFRDYIPERPAFSDYPAAPEITFAAFCECGWEHHCSEPFVAQVNAGQHLREAHETRTRAVSP